MLTPVRKVFGSRSNMQKENNLCHVLAYELIWRGWRMFGGGGGRPALKCGAGGFLMPIHNLKSSSQYFHSQLLSEVLQQHIV